jgi:hypothetical protein
VLNINILNYKSDFDLSARIDLDTKANDLYLSLQQVLINIEKEPDLYFIELKYETKNELKIRLHPGDVYGLKTLERHYSDLSFIKIDCVMRLQNKFYEITCIYKFEDIKPEDNSKEETIKRLEGDIKELMSEGKYYKVLKEYFQYQL